MEEHEVAIVGAGPAGSVCAKELAKAGVDVVLFDHSHPREKPCGGAIPARIFQDFKIPKSIIERDIHYIIVGDDKGNYAKIYQKRGGITVLRKKFDHYWLKEAIKNGAKFYDERVNQVIKKDKWILTTNKRKIKADILIGADGANSVVRRAVHFPIPKEHLSQGVCYQIRHSRRHLKDKFEDAIELHFIGKPYLEFGYFWIFPKLDVVNVGLGSKLGVPALRNTLDTFLREHERAKKINLKGKTEVYAHLIPSATSSKFFNLPTTGEKWMLIGDAAGHVNPITGEGIFYAMTDGKLAAKAYLEGDISLFEKYWRKNYGSDMYIGARLKKFVYKQAVITRLIKAASKDKVINSILGDIIASRRPYDKILIDLILNLPRLIFV